MTKKAWWGRVEDAIRSAPFHLRMEDLDYGYATACRGRPMYSGFQTPGSDLTKCPKCLEIYTRGKERGLWY